MRAILGLVLTVLGTSVAAEPSPITIRGLNLDSSPLEVESLLGECSKRPKSDAPRKGIAYQCGEDHLEGYIIDDQGRLTSLIFHCSFIEGCEYSSEDLTAQLAGALSLGDPRYGDIFHVSDGPSGDRMIVLDFREEGTYINLVASNYRKPQLKLD
ncbi:hypothetical protein [Sulfitobacter sp. R18_1]|uniref:hypothetical protein n=1 Tax=Sulfitobacter sp. R18_1 TaxID=2821104 RepID=UPI001AD957E7|nr:hypothetical protein [Sulfitobacter sp. R18_1]MBO9428142.1 hypothetical protein [Sulfitobacter sp. R18_1]